MPVYEYLCAECNGVFELLRPARESSNGQPCPVCDTDSRRIMPTDFAAYVYREGLPRRIPDTGQYWTAKGLSDKPEIGDGLVEGLGLTYPWARGGATNSEDDDREEWRQDVMYTQHMEQIESGYVPEIDARLAQESQDYVQKKVNAARVNKRVPSNKEVTPRTRSGQHGRTTGGGSTPAARRKQRDSK